MKRIALTLSLILVGTLVGFSQTKFAYVDTEYILGRIPAYEAAKKQLDRQSEEWQKEIEAKKSEVETLYKDYQSERVLLTEDMRTKREEQIILVEKDMKDLQKKYFAPEGELYKKRQELVKPIQDDVFNAIKEVATTGNYALIFDVASGPVILYTDPK